MPSFSDLRSSAEERWQPEEGGEYTTVIVECRVGETANGFPSVSLWHEVVGGEDSGERFWDNTYFSANGRANAMAFAKLEAATSVANEAFWAKDPDEMEVERALMGAKLKVRTTFDENDRDPQRPWLRCTYMALNETVEDF
jgi:hypothetical protein|tara:strand:- start:16 stop:438 length:423 start_codon:yes stop_codon:yes gene_type:complete